MIESPLNMLCITCSRGGTVYMTLHSPAYRHPHGTHPTAVTSVCPYVAQFLLLGGDI